MKLTKDDLLLHRRFLPPLGQRILKTGTAVLILLFFYMLQGGHGDVGSAIVTAIICMQPYMEDTRSYALDRLLGTVLGAVWAFAFLLLMRLMPDTDIRVVYVILSLFTILVIYSTVVLRKSSIACLTAIVFIGTAAKYPNVSDPLAQSLTGLADTIVGTIVAVCVNIFRLPRRRRGEYLFFVRTMDLVPHRFRQIPSSVFIALERLYRDGARICLVSRWAPAFIVAQMGLLRVNAPMIIMDGAALYDIEENRYLDVIPIPRENAERLRVILEGFGVGVNLYAVNEYTMSVCHAGPTNMEEKREREAMKRSPYRHYADGLPREDDYIAFMRVIGPKEEIDALAYQVAGVLPTGMFRMAVHRDNRYPEAAGLFFYDPAATVENMKHRVVKLLSERDKTELKCVDMLPRLTNYLPEHDALHLLNRLKNTYEPIGFPKRGK